MKNMFDVTFIFVIFTLLAIIIIQALHLFFYSQHMQEEQTKLIKAVLSKDITQYTQAIKEEKQAPPAAVSSDIVPLSEASDDEFAKFIETQTQQ